MISTFFNHQVTERVSNGVAAAAVATPVWYQYIEGMSQVAATLLPIAGLVWIIVQAYYFIKKKDKD